MTASLFDNDTQPSMLRNVDDSAPCQQYRSRSFRSSNGSDASAVIFTRLARNTLSPYLAARMWVVVQHRNTVAAFGSSCRCGQACGPRAYDDDVEIALHRSVSTCMSSAHSSW